jgi:hypothetical protein
MRMQLMQILIQPIEALLPVPPVLGDPTGRLLERLGPEPAGPPLGITTSPYEAGTLQHFQMLGNGRKTQIERRRQFAD